MNQQQLEDARIEALKALYPNWNPTAEQFIRKGLRLLWDLRVDDLNDSESRWVAALNALPAGEAAGAPALPSLGTDRCECGHHRMDHANDRGFCLFCRWCERFAPVPAND